MMRATGRRPVTQLQICASLAWAALWLVPWGHIPTIQAPPALAFLTDMIRLGLALALFMVPGALLSILVRRPEEPLVEPSGIIPLGFSLSVMLIAVIGLAGRVLGASFEAVMIVFAAVGLIEIILSLRLERPTGSELRSTGRSLVSVLGNPAVVLALVLGTIALLQVPLFFIDDTSYLAYLTSWQQSSHLGFTNLIYGIDTVESPRFWLAMYPMGQALLSRLSGVPGILLLGSYLELFLVPIAILASFWLARTLGLSRVAAGFAALVQVTLYIWMQGEQWPAGMWFFQNMAEDKVTAVFILAPAFFVFTFRCLSKWTWRDAAVLGLLGLSLALTHPVSQFFTVLVAGGAGLLALLLRQTVWARVWRLAVICGASLVPNALLRMSSALSQLRIPFDAESVSASYEVGRYTHVLNGMFYGLNPGVLQLVDLPLSGAIRAGYEALRWLPVIIVLAALVVAVRRTRGSLAHIYLVASAGLVLLATLPYTGWILGYFVSARLISRASWFSPVGLGAALLAMSLAGWIKARASTRGRTDKAMANLALAALAACIVFVSPVLVYAARPGLEYYVRSLSHYGQLAQIGNYIDSHSNGPTTVIDLDYADTQLLPGVSAHAVLISFREEVPRNLHNYFMSLDEIALRKDASDAIRSAGLDVSGNEGCLVIQKYALRYVVASPESIPTFQRGLLTCSATSRIVYSTPDLVLLELE